MGSEPGIVYIILNHYQEEFNDVFICLFTYLEEITNIIPHNKKTGKSQNSTANEMHLFIHSFI